MPSTETLREQLKFGAVVFAFHVVSLVLNCFWLWWVGRWLEWDDWFHVNFNKPKLTSFLFPFLWFLFKSSWFLKGHKGTPKHPEDRSCALLVAKNSPEARHHKLAPIKLTPALTASYTWGISCQGLKTEMFHLKRQIFAFYIWETTSLDSHMTETSGTDPSDRARTLHCITVYSILASVCTPPAGFPRHSILNCLS